MKASRKWLKAALASGVRKFGPAFLASKLDKFLLFDGFLDLANFLPFEFPDLDNFPDFLASSPSPNPSTSLSPSFIPEIGLLSSFLLETDLLPSFLLGAGSLVIFNIEVSGAAILLKP